MEEPSQELETGAELRWEISSAWWRFSPARIEQRFEEVIRRRWRRQEPEPPADVFLGAGEILVEVDLPGVDEGQVGVRLEGGELWIEAVRPPEPPRKGIQAARLERPRGRVERRIPLPRVPTAGRLEVRLEAGVLRVRIVPEPGR